MKFRIILYPNIAVYGQYLLGLQCAGYSDVRGTEVGPGKLDRCLSGNPTPELGIGGLTNQAGADGTGSEDLLTRFESERPSPQHSNIHLINFVASSLEPSYPSPESVPSSIPRAIMGIKDIWPCIASECSLWAVSRPTGKSRICLNTVPFISRTKPAYNWPFSATRLPSRQEIPAAPTGPMIQSSQSSATGASAPNKTWHGGAVCYTCTINGSAHVVRFKIGGTALFRVSECNDSHTFGAGQLTRFSGMQGSRLPFPVIVRPHQHPLPCMVSANLPL